MSPVRPLSVMVAVGLVILSTSIVQGDPIAPNIVALDFNFTSADVSYDASATSLISSGTYAVTSFEPVLGGTAYTVTNLDNNPGASFALAAMFDSVGTGFDVDGFFTTPGVSLSDLVITGKIPDLGLDGSGGGVLLEADVIQLEIYGSAGPGPFAFNGYFCVTGGALVTEGYLDVNDTVGMVSWLQDVSPSLVEDFDFSADFTATTHLGEIGAVPEPGTCALAALACGAFALIRRRRGW